ncbi:YjgP/YjgQ family permease [Aggregatimonas sangjinii]|uniref:YjgP/YjgQ family permease n=1 Tax=Aggregatimonas sangjinii TaxID=2583587 RepID=A0A5B7SNG4_9FLAO|nr:LptF/LptG family permease [Aggregatimonas sangjinii]QCX00106.1 YjgP/YjgQ family permease [Aggregatimonas sangjinii]
MRLLDRYILSRFLFNFFSSFVILMFIFIFQTIWLFIDDLAGKGLDIVIIGKFLFYLMPNLTEKVLPLTVLLSSILTFGTFAENYEFAAMKASGISLQRAMLPLIIFVIFLCGVTFYFANSVIPASEQKIYNMRRNIAKVKPAAAIEEGVFSDFEGMSIKVAEKYGEKDRFLREIIVHQKTPTNINNEVIKAKSGELVSSQKSDVIQLILKDGHHYQDVQTRKNTEKRKYPFVKSTFDIYRINIEIPELEQDLEAEGDISTYKMKNVSRLTQDIDSLNKDNIRIVEAFSKNIISRSGGFIPLIKKNARTKAKEQNAKKLKNFINSTALQEAIEENNEASEEYMLQSINDSITPTNAAFEKSNNILDLYEEGQQIRIVNSAKTSVSNILTTIGGKKDELDKRYKIHNLHILSLHKKFALALSCIILFFVGAPLGAIIRKGGVGLPMVIAIILFLVYYFVGVFGENYAKESNIHPILGAWVSTLIMLPLGIFLTKRATADKGGVNFASFIGQIKGVFSRKQVEEKNRIDIQQIENSLSESRRLSNDEIDMLRKSLVATGQFVKNRSINDGSEFIEIHERNLKNLILLKRTDSSGFIDRQLVKYPKITVKEVDFFLRKKRKNFDFVEFLTGKVFGFFINLIKTGGNSLKEIESKLEEISRLNESLAQLISNSKQQL